MKNILTLALILSLPAAIIRAADTGTEPKTGPTADQIKKALEDNPNIILDVLRSHKKELIEVVQEAAQDEQVHRQKEAAEAEAKADEEAFKKPYKPAIDSKAHVRGNKKAKYTLVEYSDFQCPYCGRGFTTVEELRKKYGDDIRFIYKNAPLPFHPMAMPAAQYFEAAALQSMDKAWSLHDTLFKNQSDLSEDYIKKTAKDLGLDVDKMEKDAKGDAVKDKIKSDMDEAKDFDFTGTPGFLLNGIPVRGAYPPAKFDSIIDRLNGKKG